MLLVVAPPAAVHAFSLPPPNGALQQFSLASQPPARLKRALGKGGSMALKASILVLILLLGTYVDLWQAAAH